MQGKMAHEVGNFTTTHVFYLIFFFHREVIYSYSHAELRIHDSNVLNTAWTWHFEDSFGGIIKREDKHDLTSFMENLSETEPHELQAETWNTLDKNLS